jgi:D-beta-D-heptose 7-phosphate kinase/D-beta-D-heptose 1-phosphate adenosyltransferase
MNVESMRHALGSFPRSRVLVLGDVMLDRFVYGSVERISPEGPIPILSIQRSAAMPGGAANVARNIANLGGRAILIGAVGEDEAADQLTSALQTLPTVAAQLLIERSRPTTIKTRYVADRHQILRADVEDRSPPSPTLTSRLVQAFHDALPLSDIVVLSDYGKGVLCDAVTTPVIAAARALGKPVLVDPKSRSFSKYRGASVLTPNRRELQEACGVDCSGDDEVSAAARHVISDGICDAVVVTRGQDGMSMVPAEGAAVHIRALAREVYDVSGAGDTAVAALALGLGSGADLEMATRVANLAAGIVVGKQGTASVTAGEILAHLVAAHDGRKYLTVEDARHLTAQWREEGLRIAFTNGCFDLLHPGHVSLLEHARRTADRLIVGLNSDLSVRRLKGSGRPVQGEAARAAVLASLKSVDAVVVFEDDTPLALIEAVGPDVLVKGADYHPDAIVGADFVRSRGGQVVLIDLVPEQSTSTTIQRMAATLSQGIATAGGA